MEDVVYLLLVVAALSIAAMVAFAAFAVAGTIATVCVFGAAAHAFASTMYRGIVHRGGAGAVSGPGEPSFRAYYRGQVWSDLGISVRVAWARALAETARIRGLVPQSWGKSIQFVVKVALSAYAFVGLAVGAVLAALIGIVPALVIVLVALGAWALGAPLRAWERLRRRRSGAFFDCPECHDRFPLPRYVCPTCDARHTQLAPGPFGVQRHRCTCGARLPALPVRGRERLAAECPQGHVLGEGVGSVRTFHVPVAGGPSTGKSTFLAGALVELEDAAKDGTLATAVQASSRQAYDRILDAFGQGVAPAKTSGLPPAVVAEISGKSKSALLYAYDVAGEVYGAEEQLRRDPAHGLAEGVVLLIDPFALERIKADLQNEISENAELRPSLEAPQRMLERLTGVLEEQGVDLSKLSAAICVTKIDALGIGDAIAAMPGADENQRTRAWLEQSGAGNFTRATEDAFGQVRCFPVSALGRLPGTGQGAFTPRGALAPLLWLLGNAGIEPATAGAAHTTTTHKIANTKPLDVTPKRPLLQTPIDTVTPIGNTGNFFIGSLAVGALVLAMLPISTLGGAPNPANADTTFTNTNTTTTTDTNNTGGTDTGGTDNNNGGDDNNGDDNSGDDTYPTPTPTPTPEPVKSDEPKANSPAGILERHFEHITDGEYDAAFALMSSRYRAQNPNWQAQPEVSRPYINVATTGPTKFLGDGVAEVYVKFYGHDSYATDKSDTNCRRFEGEARMVKESGHWRYDGGDHYDATVLSPDLGVCNP